MVAKAHDGMIRRVEMGMDGKAALLHVRNRMYHPHLDRWVQREPIGYVNRMSLHQYVRNTPTDNVDGLGLDAFGPGNPRCVE